MSTQFFTQLDERARRTGSLLCIGLDPHSEDLPEHSAAAARDFCLRLIDATRDVAPINPTPPSSRPWARPVGRRCAR